MADSLPGADEQERILADARSSIKRHAFSMRKAIDEENLREALRFSAAMLGELRTSQLSPQKYYELYMLAFDQLVNLEVKENLDDQMNFCTLISSDHLLPSSGLLC
jgi:vacuolar protein sorting-associated protein 35